MRAEDNGMPSSGLDGAKWQSSRHAPGHEGRVELAVLPGGGIAMRNSQDPGGPVLIYTYDVAGVSYEASQDVTHLRQHIDMHTCRIGLPASIRYDPQNPGNSIVIAEGWSGLRTGKILPLALQQAAKKQGAQKASSGEKTEEPASSRQ